MKKLIVIITVLLCYNAYSQVGVGTVLPDGSAQLDIVTTDKGILIPRIQLTSSTDTATITNGNVESLLVFNTATAADITPGYYYWYDTKWQRLTNGDDIANLETLTTLVDNGNGTITYTDEDGVDTVIDITAMIDAHETLTTLVDNGDGTMTYTDEDGVATVIDIANLETLTSLVDNGNSTMTYTDEDGVATIIDIAAMIATNETLTTLVDNGNGTITYTDEDGVDTVIDITAMIAAHETLTTLVDNGDGTMTYTDEDGVATVIDISNLETLTTLVDNGDGTMTYTDEDGVATVIDIANLETLTSLVDNGDGTMTYTDEDGAATVIDIANLETLTSLVDNGDGTMTYTDEDGAATVIDIANLETLTSLVDNGDGTMTYTDEDGVATVIDVSAIANTSVVTQVVTGNEIATHDDGDGNVTSIQETVTTLNDIDGDGIFTYTSEDGTASNILGPEPWFGVDDNAAASDNTEDIYIMGNVGIHIDSPSAGLHLEGDAANILNSTILLTRSDNDFLTQILPGGMFLNSGQPAISFLESGASTWSLNSFAGELNFDAPSIGGANRRVAFLPNGNVRFVQYPNTRDDSGATAVNNVLYTDINGFVLSAPISSVVSDAETNTTLALDNATGVLTYTNEDNDNPTIALTGIEPWFGMDDNAGATDNAEDIYTLGRVAIGRNTMFGVPANEMLAVEGSIRTTTSVYADYVFEDYFDGFSSIKEDYSFKSLEEVDAYIKSNKHLPGVTSIKDLQKTEMGYSFNLSNLSVQLLEKVEELYLHTIEQEKALQSQQEALESKNAEIETLKARLAKIEAALGIDRD
ncbi:hypothetical protein [Winogradskyella sp.]|uniref:hypothetical protein n=1 Tax=Winogradskyella sp. TaxID=1883156 RepID=UPI0026149E25|nr:hypothetical protein [Winogradskyella sp.]